MGLNYLSSSWNHELNNNNNVLRSMPRTLGIAPLQYSSPSIQLPVLQKRKLRPREFRSLAQGHTIGVSGRAGTWNYIFFNESSERSTGTGAALPCLKDLGGARVRSGGGWEAVTRRTCSDTSYVHVNQERPGMRPLSLR